MSTATATAPAATDAAPPPKGKKKLIILIAAALLVLLLGGGAALLLLKKRSAAAEGADGEHAPAAVAAAPEKPDSKAAPLFVPLDPFTVNLADREAERYAQIGVTLEIDDAKTGEQIKLYMPAIRNHILMAIADRNAAELAGREGKALLAERIRSETARALGYDVPGPEATDAPARKTAKAVTLPVKAVHFSNFIIQ